MSSHDSMFARLYPYVGPQEIAAAVASIAPGTPLRTPDDVRAWTQDSRDDFDRTRRLIVTFVVDADGALRVADRRSEHVACAGGEPVLAAGEMTLRMSHAGVEAEEVSNQSTGYCPEPTSWPAVERALSTAGIKGPDGYTRRFVFRRCGECDQINLIKDGIYECDVCGAPLST